MTEMQMWNEYIKINRNAKDYDAWCFGGNTPETANILADLVLKQIKTATASAYPLYEAEDAPLPPVGGYNIILNTKGEAICITETTKISVVPFKKVSKEHAYKEGEDDRSIEAWRECHTKFFATGLKSIGQVFTEDMLVVCEEFKVVYPII